MVSLLRMVLFVAVLFIARSEITDLDPETSFGLRGRGYNLKVYGVISVCDLRSKNNRPFLAKISADPDKI